MPRHRRNCGPTPCPAGGRCWPAAPMPDNDRLSLRLAGPDDWWFHVRGMPGSHVVLVAIAGNQPDRQTLKAAAAIAAWHSKARGGGGHAGGLHPGPVRHQTPGGQTGNGQHSKRDGAQGPPRPSR